VNSPSRKTICFDANLNRPGDGSTKKGTACAVPTYQQLDLLVLVERSGAKLLALGGLPRGFRRRYGRHGRCRSVALEQNGHHRAFGFFDEGELCFHLPCRPADEIP